MITEEEKKKRLHRCCFTGHRPEKLHASDEQVKACLVKMIEAAIADGYTTFITGMAMGVDLWAGEIVLQKRKTNPSLHLIAATPFPTFPYRWHEDWKKLYQKVWDSADYQVTVSKGYSDDVFMKRNRWLVDHSSRLIAYYNGEKGGTWNTIQYAKEKGVAVILGESTI